MAGTDSTLVLVTASPASRLDALIREVVTMRRYDDLVDVTRGIVAGQEAPERFRWRGRRWVVRAIVAHWVRTGAWW